MITAIPNQPINFSGSLLMGCSCDTLVPGLLIDPSQDSLIFQVGISPCAGAENLIDPDFTTGDWYGSGFTMSASRACSGPDMFGASVENQGVTPVPGLPYVVSFIVNLTSGSVTFRFGGFTQNITASDTYTFPITATSSQYFIIELDTAETEVCISNPSIYDGNTDLEVRLVQDGTDVFTIDYTNDPEYFTFYRNVVTVNIPMTDTGIEDGCFTVEMENPCDSVTLTSQEIVSVDATCTLKFRTCNDGDGMGFYGGFSPEVRLDAQLVRPTWEYEVSQERRSNGRISRPYADRQRIMELRIGLNSEYLHPFLSTFPLWDHFYIGQEEFVVDAETYAPQYQDVFDGTGGVVLAVRPKQELLRKVQCAEELAGCVPPPNLWVQGTGPNNDYILTQTGDRILLNG